MNKLITEQIMMALQIEKGAMEARNMTLLISEIANAEFYQLVKENHLYIYSLNKKLLRSWEEYCQLELNATAAIIDEKIEQLPLFNSRLQAITNQDPTLESTGFYLESFRKNHKWLLTLINERAGEEKVANAH